MAIKAVQQDYRRAFQKHFHAYLNWNGTESDVSKRLILIYCVECGLKYAVMKKTHIQNVHDAQPDLEKELNSHDLHKLLKRLNIAGTYSFPHITTLHGDVVTLISYHQLCRYSILPVKENEVHIQKYDSQLIDIVNWLRERV